MRTTRDYLKWGAVACALVATASAEYALARAIGMNEWVAIAVPGALDAYVLRALRAHREVLTSVLAMVGVNAASHLVSAGVLAMDWRLITAVSAIAPLVLYRVHALGTPGEWRARKLRGEHKAEHGGEHTRTEDGDDSGGREHTEHGALTPSTLPSTPYEHASTDAAPFKCLCSHSENDLCTCSMGCARPCSLDQDDDLDVPDFMKQPMDDFRSVLAGVPVLGDLYGDPCSCEHGPSKHNEHGCYSLLCPCSARRRTLPPVEHAETSTPVHAPYMDHVYLDVPDETVHGEGLAACSIGHSELSECPECESTLSTGEHVDVFQFGHDDPIFVHAPSTHGPIPLTSTPVLKLVPELPPLPSTFTRRSTDPSTARTADDWNLEHVSTGVLQPADTVLMDRAREEFKDREHVPSVRDIKAHLPSGTPRAQRVRAALKAEHAASTTSTDGSTS